MKSISNIFAHLILILGLFDFNIPSCAQASIYVSTQGSKLASGDLDHPVQTLQTALEISRLKKIKSIIIRGGEYYDVNIKLLPIDSGLTIESYSNELAQLIGGISLNNLKKNGKWVEADLPPITGTKWDFRMILVNGSFAKRSRFPSDGAFTYLNEWKVKGLPATEGYWERKPSNDELMILKYNPKDIGSIDVTNAEVTLYHQWMNSHVGIQKMDTLNQTLLLSYPASFPLGSFAKENPRANSYVIWNLAEGMTEPGQWYFDKKKNKIYYWPLEGQTIENLKITVPKYSSVLDLGSEGIENIILKNIQFSCASNKLQNEGFSGLNLDALITGSNLNNITLENISVTYTGGSAVKLSGNNILISKCKITEIGGAGILLFGKKKSKIINTELFKIGVIFKSSGGLMVEKDSEIINSTVKNVPYSGININGDSSIVRGCTIENVMQDLNDGAGIYSGLHKNVTITNNKVIGNNKMQIGIYFDEKAKFCSATDNIVLYSPIPIHCHLASNIVFSRNIFYSNITQTISCQRSSEISINNNTFFCKDLKFNGHGQQTNLNGLISFKGNKLVGISGTSIDILKKYLALPEKDIDILPRNFELKNDSLTNNELNRIIEFSKTK